MLKIDKKIDYKMDLNKYVTNIQKEYVINDFVKHDLLDPFIVEIIKSYEGNEFDNVFLNILSYQKSEWTSVKLSKETYAILVRIPCGHLINLISSPYLDNTLFLKCRETGLNCHSIYFEIKKKLEQISEGIFYSGDKWKEKRQLLKLLEKEEDFMGYHKVNVEDYYLEIINKNN